MSESGRKVSENVHLIFVSDDVQSSKRIAYPTVEPSLHYILMSNETKDAMNH